MLLAYRFVQVSQQGETELCHEFCLLTFQTIQACGTALPRDKTLFKFNLKANNFYHSPMIIYDNKTNKCI
jgi:hypothetical protein